ncbi:hypothetical protein [Pedobacter borealis]|uniref:hypothetical protein n=1 Tax=Pedobacter borealis TaxID=475254 RepID=UPI0004934163|nr:hypothetical protein [Pedobacter borealis]
MKRDFEFFFGGGIPDEKPVAGLKWDKNYSVNKQGITTSTDINYTISRMEGNKIYIDVINKMATNGVPEGTEESGEFKITGLSNGSGKVTVDGTTGIVSESTSISRGQQTFSTPNGQQKTSMSNSYVVTVKKAATN